jgi:hypothetical protein
LLLHYIMLTRWWWPTDRSFDAKQNHSCYTLPALGMMRTTMSSYVGGVVDKYYTYDAHLGLPFRFV